MPTRRGSRPKAGIDVARRRGGARLAPPSSVALAVWILLAHPAAPCSIVSSGIGEPVLGADGFLHWTAPGSWRSGGRQQARHAYWITRTSLAGEPEALRVAAPAVREGRPQLVGVVPDGSSWWRSSCSDWDPPATVACYSLLLAGPAGEALGRVTSRRSGKLFLQEDRTLLSLELASETQSANDASEARRAGPRRVLQLWRGTPLSLEAFDQPADNAWWDDDYDRRMARYPSDGWELVWEAPFPFPYDRFDPVTFTAHPLTLRSGGAPLVGAVVVNAERVFAGVFRVEREPGPELAARLDPIWQREYARARNGLAEDENGELALASPWSIAVSQRGELAMGRWAIHADCSTDRPPGFVVLDAEGELLADVRDDVRRGVDGLAFDGEDRLVVAGWQGVSTFTTRGDLLGSAPRTPTSWQEEDERLLERARALTASSPVSEWAELYRVVTNLHDDRGEPERERVALARRLIVENWPQVEAILPDDVWWELGSSFCAAHPEAPQAALRRFEAAWGYAQQLWLEVLPDCFDEPPASVLALARQWLALRDSEKRGAAEKALARWPAPADLIEELWTQAVAAESSNDFQARNEAASQHQRLLATLTGGRDRFENMLRAGGAQRRAAIAVLFSSFEKFRFDHVRSQEAPLHDALLEAARAWSTSDEELLRTIGTLLSIGHGAWQAEDVPVSGELRPIDRVLLHALDRLGAEPDDLPLWAAVAVGRLLEDHATRSPRDPRLLVLPSPEQLGLRTDLLMALLGPTTAALDAVRQDVRLARFSPHGQLEQARSYILRSVGAPGRALSLQMLRLLAGASHPRASARLWELASWMAEDVAAWDEADVRYVLGRMRVDPHNGWQSAPLLDAVVRTYPPRHELHRMAREMFRARIDEAVALANEPETARGRARGPSRTAVLPQMILHLTDPDLPWGSPSPLLDELTVADVEAIAGGATSGFEQWLPLMAISGPWPAAVPQLERLLEGEDRVRIQAAIVLSHLEQAAALQVLLQAHGSYAALLPGFVDALARYGAAAVDPLLERVTSPIAEEAAHREQDARRTAGRLLAELALRDAGFLRQASGERLALFEQKLARAVDEALERGEWPEGAAVLLLDLISAERQRASGTGSDTPAIGGALTRVLSAVDRLPVRANEVRAFLFGSGDAASARLLERLGELAGDADNPLREAALAVVKPLADEGVEAARWVIERARGSR